MIKKTPTAQYRIQHEELLTQATQLSNAIADNVSSLDAPSIRALLSAIAGKLRTHLAIEDNSLYPRLLKHNDEKIRKTAFSFQQEMGHIRTAFDEYLRRWPNLEILADPQGFRRDTRSLLRTLHDRIRREDNQLYPLLDRIGL